MKYAQGNLGRVFVLRLEDKDRLPQCIEDFAEKQQISRALCALVGGIGQGRIIVGPADPQARPIEPLRHVLEGVHEAAAVGTLFPNEQGKPKLHMHAALGRDGLTRTGCIREGIETWMIGELVIIEIQGMDLCRRMDGETGFEVLAAD